MRLECNLSPDFVGDKIRTLRIQDKWTQSQLGVLVGVSKNTVSAWENGLCYPSISHILALAKVFAVEWSYFFRKEENKE